MFMVTGDLHYENLTSRRTERFLEVYDRVHASAPLGRLFRSGDRSELATILVELSGDDASRRELASAARRYVERTHAVRPVVESWQRYLASIAEIGAKTGASTGWAE